MKAIRLEECRGCERFGIVTGEWLMVPRENERKLADCLKSPLPLGDYVAAVTKATGVKWLVEKATGGNCGCGARQRGLNEFGRKLARAVGV